MQQPVPLNLKRYRPRYRRLPTWFIVACGLIGPVIISGCGGNSNQSAPIANRFSSVSLTLRCPDATFVQTLTPGARSWAERTGAKITIQVAPMSSSDDTDIGIIDVPEFGDWAERGELALVPAGLRAAEHPYQWSGLLPEFRELLIDWGGQARAIPLSFIGSTE
jgi:hypothetical protein